MERKRKERKREKIGVKALLAEEYFMTGPGTVCAVAPRDYYVPVHK